MNVTRRKEKVSLVSRDAPPTLASFFPGNIYFKTSKKLLAEHEQSWTHPLQANMPLNETNVWSGKF